ncbi:CAP Gly-rich domain-containing protein [Phascolomyces articulosus]|uniref:CAP Gly-rich domain-containing protein n=1 Tax=Phascolomyces articulosus TaxID=60185 RepID=A0AAD5JX74_9FUNG|nr:CAP Gly-rich domain-containing protein [Phascolomyces articulosus]
MPSFFGFRKPKGLSIKSAIFFPMKKKKKKERPSTTSMISHRTTATTGGAATKDDISPFARAYDHDLATKFSDSVVNDLELLLSMETQARMDALEARQQAEEEAAAAAAVQVRSRRLTFELPTRPNTSSPLNSNNNNNNNNNRRRGSLGSIYSTTSDDDDSNNCMSDIEGSAASGSYSDNEFNQSSPPVHMNARVRLIRRPLPTYGYVRFIGHVDFAPGQEWIGIELDSRVGKNDGSVKGKRYFSTDRDRGIFALRENLQVVV